MQHGSEAATLIAAVGRRDEAAFDRLYEIAAPQLFGIVLRILRDRPSAEDALQDIFVRIWTKAATYAPEAGEPFAWMASIARHRAIDALRARPSLRQVDPHEGFLESIPAPLDEEGSVMNIGALRHCLDTLDAETRDCVTLAYCAGWSGKELAERHGRPENTVKSWLRRGLASLRGCLDKDA